MSLPKLDWKTGLIVLGVAILAIKFRNEILGLVAKVPAVGPAVVKFVG